jgi:hypothetical protein
MRRPDALAFVVMVCLLAAPAHARAERLLTPFIGAAVATETRFLDLDGVADQPHLTYGAALTLLPAAGVLGIEGAVWFTSSPFTGHDLIESSGASGATASLIIASPRRTLGLRPYAAVGAGVIHVSSRDIAAIFPIDETHPDVSAAVGAWWGGTSRLRARAEARFMRSIATPDASAYETWQITLGATIRF